MANETIASHDFTSGYVYILTNKAFPELVKIGMTSKSPESRAAELNTTGVPHRYRVAYAVRTDDYVAIEREVHRRLNQHRVNGRREFFSVTLDEAKATLNSVAGDGATTWARPAKSQGNPVIGWIIIGVVAFAMIAIFMRVSEMTYTGEATEYQLETACQAIAAEHIAQTNYAGAKKISTDSDGDVMRDTVQVSGYLDYRQRGSFSEGRSFRGEATESYDYECPIVGDTVFPGTLKMMEGRKTVDTYTSPAPPAPPAKSQLRKSRR